VSGNLYENRVSSLERRMDDLERQQNELKLFQRELVRRDYILVIVTVLSILGAGGYLGYQNTLLIGQINQRVEDTNRRIEQLERNLTARFEDLKQEVRADRQRRAGK
jgi:chaperonin cofactor prefoldin